MRFFARHGCIIGMGVLQFCGGCLATPNGATADASTLDSWATEAQTLVIDFVRQLLATFLL